MFHKYIVGNGKIHTLMELEPFSDHHSPAIAVETRGGHLYQTAGIDLSNIQIGPDERVKLRFLSIWWRNQCLHLSYWLLTPPPPTVGPLAQERYVVLDTGPVCWSSSANALRAESGMCGDLNKYPLDDSLAQWYARLKCQWKWKELDGTTNRSEWVINVLKGKIIVKLSFLALLLKGSVMECPYTDAIFLTSCIYDHYLNTQTSRSLRSSFLLELYTSEMTPAMEPSKSGNWPFAETTMTSCDGNVQGHFYICVPLQFQPI